MIRFGAVGVSGVFVNTFFLWFFTEIGGIHYLISSPMAVELSILSNFMLNSAWTFRGSGNRSGHATRLVKFHLTAFVGFLINYGFLVALTELAGWYYLLSNLAGILAAFFWNYTVNVYWTWREPQDPGDQRA